MAAGTAIAAAADPADGVRNIVTNPAHIGDLPRDGVVDKNALQSDQFSELAIGHVGNALRGVEFRIALHDPLLPGNLVQVFVVPHRACIRPLGACRWLK